MEELRTFLAVVGDSQAAVLVQGESGTGKELAARAIHRTSSRREGPFVSLNCGALPAQLLESELFGHEKGAFTGAAGAKPGQFELAHGGTIFLDEIGECSPELQVRLLRVLQEKEVQRLGGTRRGPDGFPARRGDQPQPRGRDQGRAVSRGPLLPHQRHRGHRCRRCASGARTSRCWRRSSSSGSPGARTRPSRGFPGAALERLSAHDWPGNVRELENAIERGVVVGRGPLLEAADLPPQLRPAAPAAGPVADLAGRDLPLAEVEKAVIAAAMARHGGNKSQAARALGISRKLLYSKLREYGLGGAEAPDGEEA